MDLVDVAARIRGELPQHADAERGEKQRAYMKSPAMIPIGWSRSSRHANSAD